MARGDVVGALNYFMSSYPIPQFGVMWILMGFGLYAVMFAKTRDYGICGMILTIYLAMVSFMFAPMVWMVFGLVLALHLFVMAYKVFNG